MTASEAEHIVGSKYDHKWGDYHFVNAPSDGIAPEKTKPITSFSRVVWRPLAMAAGASASLYLMQLAWEWAEANGVRVCDIWGPCS